MQEAQAFPHNLNMNETTIWNMLAVLVMAAVVVMVVNASIAQAMAK